MKYFLPTARLLVEYGANPNYQDVCGIGLMYWASACGNPELLQLLLEKGGNVNLQANERWKTQTPLHAVAESHNTQVARILVSAGANLDARNIHNQRPCELVKCDGADCDLRRLLEVESNSKVRGDISSLERPEARHLQGEE